MTKIGLMNLCTPSWIYLVVSMIGLIVLAFYNINGDVNSYCIGPYSCQVVNLYILFFIKFLYILFWTWILNIVCKTVGNTFAWILLFLPFVVFAIMVFNVMV